MTDGQTERKDYHCEEPDCGSRYHPFIWSGSAPDSDDWKMRCQKCDEKFKKKVNWKPLQES